MARKKAVARDAVPSTWWVHIAKDPRGHLHISGYTANGSTRWLSEGKRLEEIAVINCGRPFYYHVPSDGDGPSGIVFDGMTGSNAEPWTPSQLLAAARNVMFGFILMNQQTRSPALNTPPTTVTKHPL